MSAADPRRSRQAGYTMIELAVSMMILTMLALVVERAIAATTNSEKQFDAKRRCTERSERIAYEVLRDIESSSKLFDGGPTGLGYLDALELGTLAILPTARLPVFEAARPLGRDLPADPHTGNILLLARASDPAPCIAALKKSKKKGDRLIDMVRFVCMYPHQTDRWLIVEEGRDDAVDLVIWRSRRYPDASQIWAIEKDDQRRMVIADLVSRHGCDMAWDAGAPAEEAFYAMDATGTISATPIHDPRIEEDLDATSRGRLVYADCQLAPTTQFDFHRRAVLSVDDPADWTPAGFEVKLNGASGARIVWFHLVVETQSGKGILGVHTSTIRSSVSGM